MNRVSKQDLRIVREIQASKAEMREREAALKKAQARQTDVVADLAAQKSSIEGQLAERQQLLSQIKDQIAAIEAAEAKRQERLKALAEQRLQNPAPTTSSGPPETFVDGAAPPPTHGGVVGIAMRYLGVPYVWGGASPSGFDCSGLVMYVYAQVGTSLPHNAAMQYGYGSPVSRAQLAPGDLVFFSGLGHVGIYIGGGQFIHAPHTRRRRQDLQPERLVVRKLVLRRPPPLAREARRSAERFRSATLPVPSKAAMRTIWNGSINFGLVNIPIGLAVAQQRKDVSFRTLHRECGTPIKQKRWCPKHERDVEPEELVKGWEFSKGQFVIVEESDLEAVALQRSQAIEIDRFVPVAEVDPIYFDRTYYLAPADADAQRRPYLLLLEAMKKTGLGAVGKFVLWGKENLCLIRPLGDSLALETLFFAEDIRSRDEIDEAMGETKKVAKAELEMAVQLVDNLKGSFDPEDYAERLPRAAARDARGEARGQGDHRARAGRDRARHRPHGRAQAERCPVEGQGREARQEARAQARCVKPLGGLLKWA